MTETVDEKGSVVTDYQYDVNTRSGASFIVESIGQAVPTKEREAWIADGAYSSDEIKRLAAEKNIGVLTTGLIGRKARAILGKFELSEDKQSVIACPNGSTPKSTFLISSVNAHKKASRQRTPEQEERYRIIARIRNGIETVPSILRSKYGVDKMPVRGKSGTKLFFGFKVAAFNFKKLLRFYSQEEYCRAFVVE